MLQPASTPFARLAPTILQAPVATPAADHGRFVWYDLMTADPERSRTFYGALLGWTWAAWEAGEGGAYTLIRAAGRDIGGVVPLGAEAAVVPTHWMAYVGVTDTDEACERAVALGGRVCVPATDIPHVGRFAVVNDPTGAALAIIRMLEETPEPEGSAEGAFVWNELLTPWPRSAGAFYSALLEWGAVVRDTGVAGSFHHFTRGARPTAGMMQMPRPRDPDRARAFWLPYVRVGDLRAVSARLPALGGQVILPPAEITGVGRGMVIMDPLGAMIGLLGA